MKRTKTDSIVVHCSASEFGDVAAIRSWHLERGFGDIGYHAVILNGHRTSRTKYNVKLDGVISRGRPETLVGAHCEAQGMNRRSLGVCLIGTPGKGGYPTTRQLDALVHYLAVKCRQYKIQSSAITQPSDHDRGKPLCASLDIAVIRQRVRAKLTKP